MKRFSDKVIMVTGGSRGIGEAAIRRFHSEGGKVVIADILDGPGTALAIELGQNALFLSLDVSSKSSWQQAIQQTEQYFGPLNVLVNNAGVSDGGYIQDLPLETYRKVIDINQVGVFLGMQAAYPSLKRAKMGSIINVSSIYGIVSDVHSLAYVASKFAVRGMTKVAAVEFGRFGIRVNSVHPGLIHTPMTAVITRDDDFGYVPLSMREQTSDRAGLPEDIAGMMAFLASDDASYINGAELVVDGGVSLGRETAAKQHYFESVTS